MAPRSSARDHVAPWVVLVSFLALTALATTYVWETSQLSDRSRFEREAAATFDDIRFRISTYVDVLRAAGGLFAAGENVTRDQFRSYVRALDIQRRHPGIQGIGLSLRVRPQHVEAVTADLRLNDFPDFRIWPAGPRDDYHSIVLLEPLDQRNSAAIGYDMYTDDVRREAMIRARDTADVAASAPVRLVQETDPTQQQRGFLMYVPIFANRGLPGTVAERQERLYGFVYAPFRVGDLFSALFAADAPEAAFSVYDGDSLFYASTPRPGEGSRFTRMETVDVGGRRWTLRFSSLEGSNRQSVLMTAVTAGTGVIISFLVFALLHVQLRARTRAEEVADTLRVSEAELQAANRAKDEFLATLSHELRTPMTAIMGWSKLLGEELDHDTRTVAIDAIQKSSSAQAQLIEDLLDVSRITAGKMKIVPEVLELGPIISVAAAAIAPAAEIKQVVIRTELPEEPVVVRGDAARLQQIIWNLLSNGVKFTDSGGRVDVRLRREEGEAVLEVEDTGQGIEPEFLPHVFERFRQADSSSTRAYTGLGLGLAIVRHLAELHGGSVAAHSEGLGRGSRFTFRFPLLDGVEPGTEPDDRDAAQPEPLRGARILIVDDEKDVREYATAVFQMAGAEIRAAESAAEAVDVLRQWDADIVVTDIGMPGRDGYDLLDDIRQFSQVPVVALTAYAREEDRERAERAGFEAFVPKPVDPAILRDVVADVLAVRT